MPPPTKSRLEQDNQELREQLKRAEAALQRLSGSEAAQTPDAIQFPAGLGEAVLNQSRDMIALVNRDYTYRYANPAFLDAFQAGWSDIVGHSVSEVIGAQAFENEVRRGIDACFAGQVVNFDVNQTYPNLGFRLKHGSCLPLNDANGMVTGAIVILQDNTEHWQEEQAIHEATRRLNKSQHLAMMGDWELDMDSDILSWSDEVFRIFEVDKSSYTGKNPPFDAIVHPEDRDFVYANLRAAAQGRCPYNFIYRLQFPDGRVKFIHERGDVEAPGERLRYTGTVQDITEQKLTEIDLDHGRRDLLLLKNILDSATEAIWIMNSAGKWIFVNQAYEQLIGMSFEQMSQISYQEILLPETLELVNQTIRPWILTHGNWQGVIKMKDSLGQTFPVWAHLGSLCDAQAIVQYFYCFMHDDSKRIQDEEELRAARNAAEAAHRVKSEFLASMSHEIRTPLTAILGFADLLDKGLTDPRLKSYLTPIRSGGETLVTLLNDILDLSRIESGSMPLQTGPISLPGMFHEVQNMFSLSAAQKGLELSVEIDPLLPRLLMFDEVRLRQVLFNLVGNAVKFTQAGYVRLSVQVLAVDSGNSSVDLSISVADSGMGIPIDQQKVIFEAFRQQENRKTGNPGGTGLGLAICKRLVEIMNGTITVTSEVDHGSVFDMRLPQVHYIADAGQVNEFPTAFQAPDPQFNLPSNAPTHADLSPLAAQELTQLISKEFAPRWENLRGLQPVGEVRAFADSLWALGSRYGSTLLTSYAQDLRAALDNFDIACITQFLAEFPHIRASLTLPGGPPR